MKQISSVVLRTRRLTRVIRRDESLENKQRDLFAARDAGKENARVPCGTRRWNSSGGCVAGAYIPHPRYLPTADNPPSRVFLQSPRGSASPSRSAPFARYYRHFRPQYHLPPAASRPPEVDPQSCVSKHRFADQLKARFLIRARDTTKEADSDMQMYAESMNNGRVSKRREFWRLLHLSSRKNYYELLNAIWDLLDYYEEG